MTAFSCFLLLAAFAFFAARRLLRYLHCFQQDEYDARRFLSWMTATRAFDRRLSGALALTALLRMALPQHFEAGGIPALSLVLAALFVAFALFETDPRKAAKKKLAMTQRASRIYAVALGLCLGAAAFMCAAGASAFALAWIAPVQLIPVTLMLANALLAPYEARLQSRIMREASLRLAEVGPEVIGITGSFGKTSVKHILGHILEMNAPTLFTPGSVNTLMGISRIIREKLRNGCRYFLVEMGAYGQGSIARLCALTPPGLGIITAVGEAHYERFKTLDTVARAKFELAEAALSHPHGRIVLHEDVLAQDYARAFVARRRTDFVICGRGADADLKIMEVRQTVAALEIDALWQGQSLSLTAPLFGEHHADNMALAFAAAMALGLAPERAAAAMRTVPQIAHRLEVKPQPDGTIYIDDAYNSNPRGFRAALGVLERVADASGGRRILITPGLVELGARHDDIHRALGAESAGHVDVALVVGPGRIAGFVEGFRAQAPQKPLHCMASLAEAQEWLRQNLRAKDVYLIENDLPDVYERRVSL